MGRYAWRFAADKGCPPCPRLARYAEINGRWKCSIVGQYVGVDARHGAIHHLAIGVAQVLAPVGHHADFLSFLFRHRASRWLYNERGSVRGKKFRAATIIWLVRWAHSPSRALDRLCHTVARLESAE